MHMIEMDTAISSESMSLIHMFQCARKKEKTELEVINCMHIQSSKPRKGFTFSFSFVCYCPVLNTFDLFACLRNLLHNGIFMSLKSFFNTNTYRKKRKREKRERNPS